jgi:sarcosine oxidase gamma subunit
VSGVEGAWSEVIGGGLVLSRLPCTVTEAAAFRGQANVLAKAIGQELPGAGRFTQSEGATVLSLRPNTWLILEPEEGPSSGLRPPSPARGEGLIPTIQPPGKEREDRALSPSPLAGEGGRRPDEGAFATIDQSHGKLVFHLEGPNARALLMRGCRLDLRDQAFPFSTTGTTIIRQITVTLLCDSPGSRYRLIVGSTFADALVDWLRRTAAHLPV